MRKPTRAAAGASKTKAALVRCAIYTRKSSEEGLEQSFNSLDAQREACEAYVASQKAEGWIVLPRMYDDGGFSGGTMERPALRQLLADVEAGLVDTVVVYKVDRLTRSLSDFAKIVEVFDAAGASFVSVTQSFNTTTSMGRLPATDLEAIVEGRITELLGDASAMDTIVAPGARDVEERRALVARTSDLADRWPSLLPAEKIANLHDLVEGIIVTPNAVSITIRSDAILALARGDAAPNADTEGATLTLSVPATLKRVGMEMRHLIDAPQAHQNCKPDRSLLRLLARAQRFRDLILQGDGASITELATMSSVTPSYFTRIVRLSFLAPDITAAILDGRQPIELSALKLSLASLPKDWSQQQSELGFR